MRTLDYYINKYKWINRLGLCLIMIPLSIIVTLYIYTYIKPEYHVDWIYISFPSLICSIIGYYLIKYSGEYVEKLRFIKFIANNIKGPFTLVPVIHKRFLNELAGFIINAKILCVVKHIERGKLVLGFRSSNFTGTKNNEFLLKNILNILREKKQSIKIFEFKTNNNSIVKIFEQKSDNGKIFIAHYYNLKYKKDLLQLITKTLKYVMKNI